VGRSGRIMRAHHDVNFFPWPKREMIQNHAAQGIYRRLSDVHTHSNIIGKFAERRSGSRDQIRSAHENLVRRCRKSKSGFS
jgi:hypothetical protein